MLWILSPRTACALFLLSFIATVESTGRARADEPDPDTKRQGSAKDDLRPENMAKLHALIRPHDHEWRHLQVNWFTDVVAARKAATADDKPIVICYTGGAGYNEPLGIC
jgi:hypothetical protein